MTDSHAARAAAMPPHLPDGIADIGLPKGSRIVVAMSGGVDSSVTAALLAEFGYDVVGVTLQLYDHGAAIEKKGACCAGQDIYDARMVADTIGIPHYVLDYESRFSQSVMDDFADSYLRGETPIPCVRCNQRVKFRDLLGTSRDLGAAAMATGHYVRRTVDAAGRAELRRAVDPSKDQSYFLFATTAEQLDYLRFPLGGLTKAQTRALAERYDLPVAEKPDSQDICFVPTGRYADVVSKLRPGAIEPGEIVDMTGTAIGRHDGVINFTIGQRRGIGIGGRPEEEGPLYVVALDPGRHRVIVGPREALAKTLVRVKEANWLIDGVEDLANHPDEGPVQDAASDPAHGLACWVKLRSAAPPLPAWVRPEGEGRAVLDLLEPHHGVAPGQAAVFYAPADPTDPTGAPGDKVLGGGWITGAEGPADAILAAE